MRNITIKNNSLFLIFIHFIFVFIFIEINSLIYDKNIKIISNIIIILIVQMFIFLLFKLDIISSISVFAIWILIPSIMVYYGNMGNYGDLSLNFVPIYLYQDTIYIFTFIIVLSLSAYLFRVHLYEKQLIQKPFLKLNNFTILFNNIITVIFSFVAFPTIPSFNGISVGANRFQMLLPGHAWNQLAIIALLFNLPYVTKKKSVSITYLFAISWFLIHGERADISGLLFGILVLVLHLKNISFIKKIIYSIISLFFVFILISIGFDRINGYFPSLLDSVKSITTFSTVTDISYLFNVSVDYINNIGFTNGEIFLKTILSSIPFINGSNILGSYIGPFYPNPGGGSLISNLLVDRGMFGIISITSFYSYILKMIFSKNSMLFKYEFLVLICSIPRISWYGINYLFTSMIFFVPFMYYLDRYLNDN